MTRACVICGVRIEHRHPRYITCSPECSSKRKIKATKDWCFKNADHIRRNAREWYWNNRDKSLEYHKNYSSSNRELIRKKNRDYYKLNREKRLEQEAIRRETLRAAFKLVREIEAKGLEALL